MSTQGMITIVDGNDKVLCKIVAGCNGFNAEMVARRFVDWKSLVNVPLVKIYDIAIECNLGCGDCLVAIRNTGYAYYHEFYSCLPEATGELSELYLTKLQDAEFNPRRDDGKGENIYIVKLGGANERGKIRKV